MGSTKLCNCCSSHTMIEGSDIFLLLHSLQRAPVDFYIKIYCSFDNSTLFLCKCHNFTYLKMTKLIACRVLILNYTIQWQRRNDYYMLKKQKAKQKKHSLLKPLLHSTCLDTALLPHIIFWSKYIFKLASKVQHPSRFVDVFPILWVFPRQQNFRRTKHSLWKTDGNVDQVNSESRNQKKWQHVHRCL